MDCTVWERNGKLSTTIRTQHRRENEFGMFEDVEANGLSR